MSISSFNSLIAWIITAINLSYLTALYPFVLVSTISGNNSSTSWAIIPISFPSLSCIPGLAIQSKCIPVNLVIFSKALAIGTLLSFNLISEE